MPIKFVPEEVFKEMLGIRPEWAMGFHIVTDQSRNRRYLVLGGVIIVPMDERLPEVAQILSNQPWIDAARSELNIHTVSIDEHIFLFEMWCKKLEDVSYQDVKPLYVDRFSQFILDPFDPSGTPQERGPAMDSQRRPAVHGHLPFSGTTKGETIFFRTEPFPVSRYIDPSTGKVNIGGGLYGFPPSEAPFVPTGFSSVGRYALPNVAPSTFRWELRAPAGVKFHAGASVPLYGQAGGGVEVCIESHFDNVGHIANATILPIL